MKFTWKDITKMSLGGGWGDVEKQKMKNRERRTGTIYGAHHLYIQTDVSSTFFCKEDKCRQETVTKCIASKGTHLCDTHCVIHMQYLMVKSTLSGTLLVFHLVNIRTSNLSKEIN